MAPMRAERVVAAVPTPFDRDGVLDHAALDALLADLESEVDAVLMAGTTGEFLALQDPERLALFSAALRVFGAERTIGHVGAASLHQVQSIIEQATGHGLRRLALLTPYYLPVDSAAVIDWYGQAADLAGGATLYPYLFPDRTGVTVDPPVAREVMAMTGMGGLKVSGTASTTVRAWAAILQPAQQLWSGNDAALPSVLDQGGHGVISGVASAFPHLFGQLRRATVTGRPDAEMNARVSRAVKIVGPSIPLLHMALHVRTGHPWAVRMPGQTVTAAESKAVTALVISHRQAHALR